MCIETFLDNHLYQTTNNFLDAFDMNPILDKSFVPHQFDLVSIVKFKEIFSGHVLKHFQIHYMQLQEFQRVVFHFLQFLDYCEVSQVQMTQMHFFITNIPLEKRINSSTIYHNFCNINLSPLTYLGKDKIMNIPN